MYIENPAHKLHNLLEKAYKMSSESLTDFSSPSYRDTWAKVFNIEKSDTSALLTSIHYLLDLFLKTKNIIQSNECLNTEKNNKFLTYIENALLEINLNGTMKHFRDNINNEILTALYYMAENISFVYNINEKEIDEKEINSLLQEIDELTSNLIASSLPEDVKAILLKNLNLIRKSLMSYKTLGIEGIRKSLEQTIGSIILNGNIIKEEQENENVEHMFKIISRISSLITVGRAVKEYLPPVIRQLIG
jgi:hypothetical protein